MQGIWWQIQLKLISHLQDAQDLVRPADEKSLLVPACTWICAFRLVYRVYLNCLAVIA